MSLQKFADIFKLDVSKGIFPYEYFHDIEEIRNTTTWPKYSDFGSSLTTEEKDFLAEIDEILNLPMIFGFQCFGELITFLGVPFEMSQIEFYSAFIPLLSEERKNTLKQCFFISPKIYFEQKSEFERKIEQGVFSSFLDYLIFYNDRDLKKAFLEQLKILILNPEIDLDCELLTQAFTRLIETFNECFGVHLLDKLSLPGISEEIMWSERV